jgi:hypothetical protein
MGDYFRYELCCQFCEIGSAVSIGQIKQGDLLIDSGMAGVILHEVLPAAGAGGYVVEVGEFLAGDGNFLVRSRSNHSHVMAQYTR